ncbi:MAG TPA: LD-carboxypeptidase [Bacteroidia bacterium]|nr:LD-carboxypeptidase [Bacteroidia bacterium]
MNKTHYLKQNDKIAIVATARKISAEELVFAIETFKAWGLQPVLGKNIYAIEDQFAGSDKQRAEDLQWAINDDNIKAVIIARGGYGTVRIVDAIDFTKLKTNPKFIIGYSDVTVLHSHIHTHIALPTLHATMPINFDKNTEAVETLKKCLFGETVSYQFESHLLNKTGEANGVLVGGNLSLLYALSGTASDIDTKGKILFLEDLDEYLYHIDRMMLNLKRSGKLANLKALVVGGFTDMKDNTVPFGKTAEEIILDAVKEYNFPVCFNFPAGHIDRNLALYFGKEVSFKISKTNCSLSF